MESGESRAAMSSPPPHYVRINLRDIEDDSTQWRADLCRRGRLNAALNFPPEPSWIVFQLEVVTGININVLGHLLYRLRSSAMVSPSLKPTLISTDSPSVL